MESYISLIIGLLLTFIITIIPLAIIITIIIVVIHYYRKIKYKNYSEKLNQQNIKNYDIPSKRIILEENINAISIKEEVKKNPYNKKYLLTKNELYFYKQLKELTDELDYVILTKIRLADLIEVNSNISKKEYYTYFNKISAKHIDFALCNKDNLNIIYLIELDDKSHQDKKRSDRDTFINEVVLKCGYNLIRAYSIEQVKAYINNN